MAFIKHPAIIQGVIMTDEGEIAPKQAWQPEEKISKERRNQNAMKKNIPLEATLFGIVCAGFVVFNVYYWTRDRQY